MVDFFAFAHHWGSKYLLLPSILINVYVWINSNLIFLAYNFGSTRTEPTVPRPNYCTTSIQSMAIYVSTKCVCHKFACTKLASSKSSISKLSSTAQPSHTYTSDSFVSTWCAYCEFTNGWCASWPSHSFTSNESSNWIIDLMAMGWTWTPWHTCF